MNKLQTAGLTWGRAALFQAACTVAGAAVLGLAPVASGWAQSAASTAAVPAGKPIKVALIESLSGAFANTGEAVFEYQFRNWLLFETTVGERNKGGDFLLRHRW